MCGEFGEVTVIIGLVINFLAVGTLLLNSHDTLSYTKAFKPVYTKAFKPVYTKGLKPVYTKAFKHLSM